MKPCLEPVHIFITLFLTSALVLPTRLWPGLSSSWYFAVMFTWTLCVCVCVCVCACACYLFLHLIYLLHCPNNIYFPRVDSPSVRRPTHCWGSDMTLSNTHTHSVGLLWKTDRPVPENSTWQHATLRRDIHASGGIRTLNPSKRAAEDPRLIGIGCY